MIIVFNHFEFFGQYGLLGRLYHRFLQNATFGVDYFFMLSGFGMMLGSLVRDSYGDTNNVTFRGSVAYARRHIKKIYPIYFLMLLIGIPYEVLTGVLKYGYKPLIEIIKSFFFFFIDLTVLQSSSGSMMLSHSLNGVCWFLSCLLCIYIVSPSIILFIRTHIRSVQKSLAYIVISIAMSVFLSILFSQIDSSALYFDDLCYGSPNRRVFYVITGMLIANIFHLIKMEPYNFQFFRRGLFEYISIGLSIVWYLIRQALLSHITLLYIVDMILVSCDLFALAIGKGRISAFFRNRHMVFLGNISMYIFITHYLIRGYIDLIVQVFHIQNVVVGIMEIIISLILTFIVSINLYKNDGRIYLFDRIIELVGRNRT